MESNQRNFNCTILSIDCSIKGSSIYLTHLAQYLFRVDPIRLRGIDAVGLVGAHYVGRVFHLQLGASGSFFEQLDVVREMSLVDVVSWIASVQVDVRARRHQTVHRQAERPRRLLATLQIVQQQLADVLAASGQRSTVQNLSASTYFSFQYFHCPTMIGN